MKGNFYGRQRVAGLRYCIGLSSADVFWFDECEHDLKRDSLVLSGNVYLAPGTAFTTVHVDPAEIVWYAEERA